MTASPTLCTDPPWVWLASETLGPHPEHQAPPFLGRILPFPDPTELCCRAVRTESSGGPQPWGACCHGGSLELVALGGGGKGRVKVLMGRAAHTCRGSLASPPQHPPGANFYQREPSGQGVGTQLLPIHYMGLFSGGDVGGGGQEMLLVGP